MSTSGGRGLGPGPVFVYEWITSARRWQPYALRSLFVLGLLVAVAVMAMSRGTAATGSGPTRFVPRRSSAKGSSSRSSGRS